MARPTKRTVRGPLIGLALLAAGAATARAQQEAEPLAMEARWSVERYLSGRTPLELELSRRLSAPAERVALVIEDVDVSALVAVHGTRVTFRPTALRLPAGESEVVAYVVSGTGEWRELGRFPLRVRNRIGLDQGRITPTADVSSTGQLDRSLERDAPPPERRTYQDVTLRLGIDGVFARSGWTLRAQGNALGVTREEQRLRFGEMQGDAPALDLSDYRMQLARGPVELTLGNVAVGSNRYLLNRFGSRGVTGGVRIGGFAAVRAAVVNGTNVVGWSNPFGVTRPSHRMSTLTLGLELVPGRPGAIHIDVSGFSGSVLPRSSFNQGAATDAEESRGFGVQVAASTAGQRLRFSGGISRSRFDNPADPALAGDTTLVAVREVARTARFGEVAAQLLQGFALTATIPLSLGATVRHERVDPLYRSVGAYVRSDVESNGVDLSASVGPLALQAGFSGARDNLAGIASILTTKTRNRALNVALPLGALFGAEPQAWYLPSLSVGWQRVHQFGTGLPLDGGFSASHVPDQLSSNGTARLDWSRGSLSFGYGWSRSHQDNRQEGRERADFRTTVHALTVGMSPLSSLSVSIDLSFERQRNYELQNTQRLERLGGSLRLTPLTRTTLSGMISQSWGFDPFAEQRTRNTELSLELSQGFSLYGRGDGGTQGRLFLRYARSRAAVRSLDPVPLLDPLTSWTLNAGASFRLY